MLSRTAQNLYWMGRYIERADATARLLEMGRHMALLPGSSVVEEWRSVAQASGAMPYLANAADLTPNAVVARLLLDEDNRSSIRACFVQARANGKAVRTALTQDMWEALNEGWRTLEKAQVDPNLGNLTSFIEWTKQRAAAFRGATETSLMRNDGYSFLRIGEFVERANMVLRLLDVKYYVLLPETDVVGGGRDYHQWTSVLRATSAMRAYHHVNRGDYTPWGIAEFLILNATFPRSIAFCYRAMKQEFDALAALYGEETACQGTVEAMARRLETTTIQSLFQAGLHEFIAEGLETTNRVGAQVSEHYHF